GHGGPVVAEQGTGFSRVRSPGRGVRPPPPTPGRWADAGRPGVPWRRSTSGRHRSTIRRPVRRQHAHHSDPDRAPAAGRAGRQASGTGTRAAAPHPRRLPTAWPPRPADDLLRAAETFVSVVELALGLAHPSLLDELVA